MPRGIRLLEVETVHELAHQWFQSVVATNEAETPWLDEGFTDYSAARAMNALYDGAIFDYGGWRFSYLAMQRLEYQAFPNTPMTGKAWDFDNLRYGVATYAKPSLALTTIERTVGETAMRDFTRAYFDRYAFGHPTEDNVRAVMAETLGADVAAWFFDGLVYGDGTLDAQATWTGDDAALERRGALCIPTTVSITRRTPQDTETRPWTCDVPSLTIEDTAKMVEIDPDNAIVLDRNLANNGIRRTPDVAPWLGIAVRWLRLLQDSFWGGAAW
jgi:aminopeptidase N